MLTIPMGRLEAANSLAEPKGEAGKGWLYDVGAKRAAMQVTMTLEPKPLRVCSFLTSFFLSMFTLKLKKYNKPLVEI